MEIGFAEISVKGKIIRVPAILVNGTTIILEGNWIKKATIKDEFWIGGSVIGNPESIIGKLKETKLGADIFSFSQKLPFTEPTYNYHLEWSNLAAIRLTSFSEWWKSLPQEARKNVRRAEKRGVVVRQIKFDDEFVNGIIEINNETPVRQGRFFWHYGKDFESVKKDYSDFLDRSEFLGAYYQNTLIGFIRLIYMGEIVSILQLLTMNKHYDKRPANALIAKAVELCSEKGVSHIVYGQYNYDGNTKSPLTEFKRRNGFEQILIPTYYIPLTAKGWIHIKLGLHLGIKRLIPTYAYNLFSELRSKIYHGKIFKMRSHLGGRKISQFRDAKSN
jgi:hypothetical protein